MKRFIENHRDTEYDIIIIGGGITGACVAYEAAGRGLSVALVEKKDFGSGTSSVTSKLIHGGLRYLVTGEYGLVRESLRERRVLENIAPNFVYPMPTMITTSRTKLSNTRWIIGVGMLLYDLLSFDKGRTWDRSKRIPGHKSIGRESVLELEPGVRREGLTGASVYYDCLNFCPERMTLAFIKSAVKYGAHVANYAEMTDFLYEDASDEKKKVTGVRVKDTLKGTERRIKGRLTINCGGPWADLILGMARKTPEDEQIRRSEGIHIITRQISRKHVMAIMTPGGRHFFIIPWRNHSLIGTTDKVFTGSPDEYRVTRQSIEELLEEVNQSYGTGKPLTYRDVLFFYGGLRPLVEDHSEDVYKTSRKYEIYDNGEDGLEGLITVEGGKYTTSRNLAQNVLKLIEKKTGWPMGPSISKNKYLSGCEIEDMKLFLHRCSERYGNMKERHIDYLSRLYGTEIYRLMEIAGEEPAYGETLNRDGEMPAQVAYAVRHEMAVTLEDILFRRTGLGTLGHPGKEELRLIANVAARELGWDRNEKEQELARAGDMLALPQ